MHFHLARAFLIATAVLWGIAFLAWGFMLFCRGKSLAGCLALLLLSSAVLAALWLRFR